MKIAAVATTEPLMPTWEDKLSRRHNLPSSYPLVRRIFFSVAFPSGGEAVWYLQHVEGLVYLAPPPLLSLYLFLARSPSPHHSVSLTSLPAPGVFGVLGWLLHGPVEVPLVPFYIRLACCYQFEEKKNEQIRKKHSPVSLAGLRA